MNSLRLVTGSEGCTTSISGIIESDFGDRRQNFSVVGLLLQAGIDGERERRHEQGVSVGRGLGHDIGADRAAAAGPVADDDRLSPLVGKPLRDKARDGIGGTARHERNHQLDLLARIGLRLPRRGGRNDSAASARRRRPPKLAQTVCIPSSRRLLLANCCFLVAYRQA